MDDTVLIQAIGLMALLIAVSVFQLNSRKVMLVLGVASASLWTVHFLLLGALTASVMNFLGALRCYAYYKVTPNRQNRWMMWLFVAIFAAATAITWKGAISLLPFVGSLFGIIGFWQKKPKYIRRLTFASSPPWLVHNIIVGSYPGIFAELLLMTSNLVGQYRFDFKKNLK